MMHHRLILALLLSALFANASDFSSDSIPFYLADREFNERQWHVAGRSTLNAFSSDASYRDILGNRIPVSYFGSLAKPYDSQLPVEERHCLGTYASRGRFLLALYPYIEINAIKDRTTEETMDIRPGPDGWYTKKVLHAQDHASYHYGGIANIGLRMTDKFLTCAFGGGITQHSGYDVLKRDINGEEISIQIIDYEREDISPDFCAGPLFVDQLNLFDRMFLLSIGAMASLQIRRTPLRGAPTWIEPSDYYYNAVEINFAGYKDTVYEAHAWVDFCPAFPLSSEKQYLLYRGRKIHGATISNARLDLRYRETIARDYLFNAGGTDTTTSLDSVIKESKVYEMRALIEPEIFITKMFSMQLPVQYVRYRYQGSFAAIAADIRMRIPVRNLFVIESEFSTGEFVIINKEWLFWPSLTPDMYYRAYTATLFLGISGMWGARDGSQGFSHR